MAMFEVKGVSRVMRGKLSSRGAVDKADRVTRDSMYTIGRNARRNAPVDTGLLRSTMVTGIRPTPGVDRGSWEMVQGVEYTLVQEYEHSSKSAFIRNAFWDEGPKFKDKLKREFGG